MQKGLDFGEMKRSKPIPVTIEEDHHEVLPHIYRSIGCKKLPFKGITLVHFDSHPDMLIPLDMPADIVRQKQELFNSLSIENWIIPAVYAGHINHVVWIKPPWCKQVKDKQITCYVGKCCKTGTIRTSCTESYFLSEALYVDEDQLENKQLLTFTILSLIPEDWDTLYSNTDLTTDGTNHDIADGNTDKIIADENEDIITDGQNHKIANTDCDKNVIGDANNDKTADSHIHKNANTDGNADVISDDNNLIPESQNDKTADTVKDIATGNSDVFADGNTDVSADSRSKLTADGKHGLTDNSDDSANCKRPKTDDNVSRSEPNIFDTNDKANASRDDNVQTTSTAEDTDLESVTTNNEEDVGLKNRVSICEQINCHGRVKASIDVLKEMSESGLTEYDKVKASANNDGVDSPSGEHYSLKSVYKQLSELLDGKTYILDIDLDFYSTANPFKGIYNDVQYKILSELYRYEKPISTSKQDLEVCVLKRQRQLVDLKDVFTSLEENPKATINHPRQDLIQELITSLKSTSTTGSIDYMLLHDAGCTFDDTDLPHHISSNTQIDKLIDVTQDCLSYLHKPSIITIARSSCDDYCPPNQVDFIQEHVLSILQDLYLELDVNFAYREDLD